MKFKWPFHKTTHVCESFYYVENIITGDIGQPYITPVCVTHKNCSDCGKSYYVDTVSLESTTVHLKKES